MPLDRQQKTRGVAGASRGLVNRRRSLRLMGPGNEEVYEWRENVSKCEPASPLLESQTGFRFGLSVFPVASGP